MSTNIIPIAVPSVVPNPTASALQLAEPMPLFISAGDLIASVRPTNWLIKNFLEQDAVGCLFGASGEGKSFFAFDIACSVATGTSWHGSKVAQGPVIYLAGEGKGGIARRLAGWQKSHGTSLAGAPLYVSQRAVPIFNADSAKLAVQQALALCPPGQKPALVVIDTLARSFVGGDENSTADMNQFICNVDTLLREPWGAHVLIVHHTGLGSTERARGSTVLKGALDQEFQLEAVATARRLNCKKMKDAAEPPPRTFSLDIIDLGTQVDNFGDLEMMTSRVPRLLADVDMPAAAKQAARDEMTPAAIVDIMLADGWPGLRMLAAHFGCRAEKVSSMLERMTAMGLVEKPNGKRDFSLTARGRSQASAD